MGIIRLIRRSGEGDFAAGKIDTDDRLAIIGQLAFTMFRSGDALVGRLDCTEL